MPGNTPDSSAKMGEEKESKQKAMKANKQESRKKKKKGCWWGHGWVTFKVTQALPDSFIKQPSRCVVSKPTGETSDDC